MRPREFPVTVLVLLASGVLGCRTMPGTAWPHVGQRPATSEITRVGRSTADSEQPTMLDDRPRADGPSPWTKLFGRFDRPRRIPLPRTDQIDTPPEPSDGSRGVFDF